MAARSLPLLTGLLLLAVPAGVRAQKPGEVPRVEPAADAPRGEVLESTSAEGQPFWYRLPERRGGKDAPDLVLMLHGTGVPYGWAFWNYPIQSGRFRPDDIVVAPEGMTPGQGDSFNFLQGKKDGDQLAGLIRSFRREFDIDKVYVYGHSQGAFFAYWFAGDYPELVDGIVAHAGNVLSVNHSRLAKDKVAIGILHGAADAVVPVECAYRTERIYREQGYRNVRLEVVEGLTAQSGHWPLPVQVAQMMEWLDQVTADSPGQCLAIALGELAKESPDLAVVRDALERAGPLLKKHKGDDAELLAAQHEAISAWWTELESRVTVELTALQDQDEPEEATAAAPWVWPFLEWHPLFEGSKAWQKAFSRVIKQAEKQDKEVDKAAGALDRKPTRKTLTDALEVLVETPLARSVAALARAVDGQREAPPKGVEAADFAAWDQVREARAKARETWRTKTRERAGRAAAELRQAHPDWFVEGDGG